MKRIINKNKYIERNLCVTLVIYQESLHDARSTKCKKEKKNSLAGSTFLSIVYNIIFWIKFRKNLYPSLGENRGHRL
jgi:hypothetical protein